MTRGFDREWQLDELLDAASQEKIGPALSALLGGDFALTDQAGKALWGQPSPEARREALILELEPVGYLLSSSATPAALSAARQLMQNLLRAQVRFKMASTLHLESVAEDFESLKREHARLSESEARYKALSGELEARVKKQVGELEERQQMLYEAEKLASVGQLAAGMAHEINNPLGFVRSNLTTFEKYLGKFGELKTHPGPLAEGWQALDLDFILEDGIDLLHDSAKGMERIARIVADLKAFSNVDRASQEYADLNNCLREAVSMVEARIPPGIQFRLDLLPLPGIVCLPGHINQLFFNVIRNAVLAIADSGRPGEVKISSEADETGIHIRIHDTGVGMTAEQIGHAFEPFYTTRPVGSGVGLGLATARNVVQAHSGRISLDSQPDAGTTVSLFFPTPP
ncbi:MAG: HAMP domain-containing histidine kinase [Gammaproteobacteria bacterium]|nr:HAMP domain-containing histidine kinase [Gammaproteobacteria bacterium]MBU1602404.1 HAMP domain-containing histidine kinase [Gammaproteobacteria bacterium]MBU2433209.1 HAMP domain-containing histidine kinase [Gammaproteobacteria bacterium]MBU2451125.1 HAMP domain-containing histidine kinase [Gammaproteobacteria bacterium]